MDSPEAILDFWFGDSLRFPGSVAERVQLWFTANAEFDREIRDRFSCLPDRALRGELDGWSRGSESALALVLILDQFPRNLFRGSARAFAFDPKALEVARKLATGSQLAVRFTKRALNNWVRQAGPLFDTSLALEMLGFFGDDSREGVAALKEKREPVFPSARG